MTDGCTIACLQQSAQVAAPAITNGLMGLMGSLGGGALAGYVAGKALRMIVRIVMLIVGFLVLVLMFLSYKGIFNVSWDKTEASIRDGMQYTANEVTKMVSDTATKFNDGSGWFGNDMIVMGGVTGFTTGFLLGVRRG